VGKWRGATGRHCKDRGGVGHAQTGPQEAPPAESDSRDKSWKRDHTIQHSGDTQAGRLDGRTSNVQRVAQPMHEEGQCSTG